MRKAVVRLSVELLEALQDCVATIQKLSNLLREDREDMPGCVNGEILNEYLRGTDGAKEILSSLLANLQAILAEA